MYYKMQLADKVRVPPNRLGEDLTRVILDVLQEHLEGSIDKEIGIFISITKVLRIGEGEIVPGDGAVYYDVDFEAVVLRLALQEVLEGLVVETTSFGAFVSLGPIDAMLHVSQISDEYINYDEKNARLICQESKRFIGVGEPVRVRVVTLSLNEREPRDSKIGLTMRQSGLGTARWLEEDMLKEKEKEKEKGGERGSR
ncbi:MAG: DNA-directed RNA polymerase subunit E' [Methanoregulaceae archaeon PtaU1.Bin059]|jgi:DNA-directed RNA polymerase subunit E'|nr:MAG: DNA-directed RNA polymerase subunit E' [Methanoregulaceae archaeon PtaB.Bin009]OPY40323.1 MAG: DNA-directed RNA polymerase subunit E' [Methanoregulaceae archaeon PtaU1.Bin059]HII76892.1 DNA-directed RNA polymerase [Methanolinea sp.]HNS82757.1 DNA-directed RNA polymerase [Methanolinea sp.]